jgi:hypothetical protein
LFEFRRIGNKLHYFHIYGNYAKYRRFFVFFPVKGSHGDKAGGLAEHKAAG